jgi:arylsulfatase A-like enzyme
MGRTVTRRGVLAGAGALAAAMPTALLAHAEAAEEAGAGAGDDPPAPATRPNILCFVSEDNNPFIGAYGDPLAQTPHLDRLAAEGIRYERAYSTSPVCAPSRFALITGMYAESCGPAQHMRALGRRPAFARGFPEYLRAAGYYCTNGNKTDYNTLVDLAATWDASGAAAHWRDRPAGAPFFTIFNNDRTHESRIFDAPLGTVTPEQVRVPAYLPDDPAIRYDRAAYYELMRRMDEALGNRLAELEAAGLAEDTIVIHYSDNGGVLPRSKRYCYEDGLRTSLIVRIPEKWRHLAPGGPGTVVSEPVSFIDLPPTILMLAGVPVPEHMHGSPFLGAGAAGASAAGRPPGGARYAFGGRNRMDERYDFVRTVTDGRYRYIRNYTPHRPWGQHVAYAWQQKGYQVWEREHLAGRLTEVQDRFWRTKPVEELYDLRADPDQITNLAADPAHQGDVLRLRLALYQHMVAIRDNGFIPEGATAEGYDECRAPGAYPIVEVIALAELAVARRTAGLPILVAALTHGNEVMRYWAAQGLLMLGPRAQPAAGALAARLDAEPSPQVTVVVAEALAGLGQPGPAVAKLAHLLDTSTATATDPEVRIKVQALNALTYVGPAALAAMPSIQAAAANTNDLLHRAGRYLELVLTGQYTPGAVTP